jgi:hypothetical protein
MRWAGHVAHMGEERKSTRFWWESPKERDRSEDRGVDVRMGSEWIFGRWAGECRVDRTGTTGGLLLVR